MVSVPLNFHVCSSLLHTGEPSVTDQASTTEALVLLNPYQKNTPKFMFEDDICTLYSQITPEFTGLL